MSDFDFSLNPEEKEYLLGLVRWRISRLLTGKDTGLSDVPPPPTEKLKEHLGAFVTLKIGGHLRGCIGSLTGDRELYLTVAEMAKSAAFSDPRFPPLTLDEFEAVDVDISILSEISECPDPDLIEIGRHGLLVRKGAFSGLLLPQVPVEWNWDRETFLRHTCRKAGLNNDCWQDPATKLYWFQAEVF